MNWKTDYRSFYYEEAAEPSDLSLPKDETALLSIDVQNTYMTPSNDPKKRTRWAPFHKRMHEIVIPTTVNLQNCFRQHGMDVLHARIACLLENGKDRSLSHIECDTSGYIFPESYLKSYLYLMTH